MLPEEACENNMFELHYNCDSLLDNRSVYVRQIPGISCKVYCPIFIIFTTSKIFHFLSFTSRPYHGRLSLIKFMSLLLRLERTEQYDPS